jgi:hypothetical protein
MIFSQSLDFMVTLITPIVFFIEVQSEFDMETQKCHQIYSTVKFVEQNFDFPILRRNLHVVKNFH